MKKKDYIYDNGKIRNCVANILKMNPFEWCYYSIFHWNYLGKKLLELIDCLKEIALNLLYIIQIIIVILLMPLFAHFTLKNARKYWGEKK